MGRPKFLQEKAYFSVFPVLREGARVDGAVDCAPELGAMDVLASDVYVVRGVLRSGAIHDVDYFLCGKRGPAVVGLGGFWGGESVTGSGARIFQEEAVIDVLDLVLEKGGKFVTEVL
ncbi:hypothetical protein NDU88_002346 [Pleurodeles waltl]|uniref:Uncharacterized protein n=1 Tax=Pleurodeles waltl TaxID=8319 RepID=A0AAV7U906_PLEWA|nr:hypothetical protein NDU88_002346 [Pleurodeles waltl]